MVWKAAGGAETFLVATDSNVGAGNDAGTPGSIVGDFPGPAAASNCGDQLLLRVKLVSGTSDYIEFGAGMAIP